MNISHISGVAGLRPPCIILKGGGRGCCHSSTARLLYPSSAVSLPQDRKLKWAVKREGGWMENKRERREGKKGGRGKKMTQKCVFVSVSACLCV